MQSEATDYLPTLPLPLQHIHYLGAMYTTCLVFMGQGRLQRVWYGVLWLVNDILKIPQNNLVQMFTFSTMLAS